MLVVVCDDSVTSTDYRPVETDFVGHIYTYTKTCLDDLRDYVILLEERYESRSGWHNPLRVMMKQRLFAPNIQKRYRSSLPKKVRVNEPKIDE